MKTIVEALQDLYIAMGGDSDNVSELSLNPDVIEQIASLVSSGETKELPAVTADDNDKVLAVVNGAWDKAEASGGGVAICELAWSDEHNASVASMTMSDIRASLAAGVPVVFVENVRGRYIPLAFGGDNNNNGTYNLIGWETFGSSATKIGFNIKYVDANGIVTQGAEKRIDITSA